MRLGLVAALVLLSLPHLASAQAPSPEDAILLACDTAGGIEPQARDLLPVCPREDPAQAPAHEHDDAPAPPAPAEDPAAAAQTLADAAVATATSIPEDPAGAPEKLLAFVAFVVDFVKGILSLPATGLRALGDALATARASATAALQDAGDAVGDAARALLDALTPARAPAAAPKLPRTGALPPVDAGARGVVDRVHDVVGALAP